MTEDENDALMRALIRESEMNAKTNPAHQADLEFKPAQWTQAQERELVERIHGAAAERIDKLIAEANERARRS